MKNKIRNSIFILILTLLIIGYLLKDNYKDIIKLLVDAKFGFIAIAALLYILYFIIDTIPFYNFTKQYSKDIKFKNMIHLNVLTKFFNGITPLSTGGQPFQIIELKKRDISTSNATNIIVQNYIIFQIALVFWGIVAIILNKTMHLFSPDPALKQLCIIGYTLNFLILAILFFVSYSERMNKFVTKKIIGFLHKIKIVKHKEKQIAKWDKICEDFYINSKLLMHNKKIFLSGVFMQMICLTIYYSLPFVLSYSINCSENLTLVATLSAGAYVFLMGCYVPIPGASGGMEYAFLGFFGNYIFDYKLNALLLLWRFLTYYLPTIIGGITFIVSPSIKENNSNKTIEES